MRVNQIIALIVWAAVLFSCSSPVTNSQTKTPEKIIETSNDEELSREDKRKQIEEENRVDSLRLVRVLDYALSKIKSKSFNSSFKQSFQVFPDSLFNVDVKIDYDYHFGNNTRHLIIHRFSPGSVQIDIFTNTNKDLEKILSHEQWALEYTGDTLVDINGDGLKDFVVNWYGSTGCCLKAHAEVYMISSELNSFSGATRFINPTFSANEQVIRGVCYGHPGETELYKYKWSGEKIDTLEYVAYELDEKGKRTGKIIISNQYPGHNDYKIIRKANVVPKEYRSIEGYDWFTNEYH